MTDCYCDFEPATIYRAAKHKAKKEHGCDECHKGIFPGEPYERVEMLYDGWSTFRTCPRCLDLREYVEAHVPCFCYLHGNVIDDAIETAREYAREAPGLLFGAYRRLIAIRRAAA